MPACVLIGAILNRFDKIAFADATLDAIAGYCFGRWVICGDSSASMQWVIASIPVAAVKRAGRPRVKDGSQMEVMGTKLRLARMSFSPLFMMITAPEETSLPVPDVVGMAIKGATVPILPAPPRPAVYCSRSPFVSDSQCHGFGQVHR